MRITLCAALAVLGFACAPRPQPVDASEGAGARAGGAAPIFREISIAPHGAIALGALFAQRARVARAVAPGLLLLVGDGTVSYGGTDSLLVEVGADEQVRSLHFVYPAAYDFAAGVAEYTAALGVPRERFVRDSAGGYVERVTWVDARTQFTLQRSWGGGLPPHARAVLRDADEPRR